MTEEDVRRIVREEMRHPTMQLMPDGSVRPLPAYWRKPQGQWTEEEQKQAAADQQEQLEMQRRLSHQEGDSQS